MRFGSIRYLNLLPFQIFLKRAITNHSEKMFLRYRRAVPSKINHALRRKDIDAAFVSSVTSARYHGTDLGIIAHQRVYSVLLIEGEDTPDPASATSNRLAKILGLEGKVLIGDAALKHYLEGHQSIDLAQAWFEKTGLPFVFARLCYTNHGKRITKLARAFSKQPVKIPYYILKKESMARDISPQELKWYLRHISYQMDWRAKRALKHFLRQERKRT